MNKLFTQLIAQRNLKDEFFEPQYEALTPPEKLPDMQKAVDRIKTAVEKHEKVLIYGDYDVDGITASTLMFDALRLAGLPKENLRIMLPDRFIDGYGMSTRLVNRAAEESIDLVITVDCGSRNHDIVNQLNAASTDVIITDHHECTATLPDAIAVINPHRQDYTDPTTLKQLAGVGVAFKLAQALVNAGLIPNGQEKWLLDLVLLGTICDSMILTGENRILGYYGLIVLKKTRRPGLKELIRAARVRDLTSENISFRLGPRLNAAGRLATAETSLDLLRATSRADAARLAAMLEELNNQRRAEQTRAISDIKTRGLQPGPVIIETGPWNEGILGIIAGRLVDTYHRPAFVLSETERGVYKGSGRSFGDFNLASALEQVKDLTLGGGGHAAAAGVRLKSANLNAFREQINNYYGSLNLTDQERYLVRKPDLTVDTLEDFNLDLIADLAKFEPFGPGNEEPLFCLEGIQIVDYRRMGPDRNHLRLDLRDRAGRTMKSIAFGAPEPWFKLADLARKYSTPSPSGAPSSDPAAPNPRLLVRPVINEYQGTRSTEFHLVDLLA